MLPPSDDVYFLIDRLVSKYQKVECAYQIACTSQKLICIFIRYTNEQVEWEGPSNFRTRLKKNPGRNFICFSPSQENECASAHPWRADC